MKPVNPDRCRRSIRLKEYDYSKAGAYFVTVCTENRALWLNIEKIGPIAEQQWLWLGERYDHGELDAFVVMPNHVHGILVILDERRGGSRTARKIRKPLGRLIGAFKTTSSKIIHQAGYHQFAWQRNYYEHIIRDEKQLNSIRAYIAGNPLQWAADRENPGSPNYNMDYNVYMEGIYADTPDANLNLSSR